VTYVTEVERIPQLDGSVIVVTTVRGSDGSVFIDEERIPARAAPSTGADRGIGTQSPRPGAPDRSDDADASDATDDSPDGVIGGDPGASEDEFDEAITQLPDILGPGQEVSSCDPAALDYDFSWPPPEPSARVEIPRALVLGGIGEADRSVNRIQLRVQAALENAGYLDQAYYTIGCNGFAIITRMEQIDRNGDPLEDGMRFNAPGEEETWSLTGYLTRLFYAPPGYYRQIILAGTDEPYDEDNLAEAPDEDALGRIFSDGSDEAIAIDARERWGAGHRLHALIYEFETQGTRNVKQRRPSPIPGERHVEASGIYQDLDD